MTTAYPTASVSRPRQQIVRRVTSSGGVRLGLAESAAARAPAAGGRSARAVIAEALTPFAARGSITSGRATRAAITACRIVPVSARDLSWGTRCADRTHSDRRHNGRRDRAADQPEDLPPRHGARENPSDVINERIHIVPFHPIFHERTATREGSCSGISRPIVTAGAVPFERSAIVRCRMGTIEVMATECRTEARAGQLKLT